MPSIDIRQSLLDWLESQRDFGFLNLPSAELLPKLQQLDPQAVLKACRQVPKHSAAAPPPTQKQSSSPVPKSVPHKVTPEKRVPQPPTAVVAEGLASGAALATLPRAHRDLAELRNSFADCQLCAIAQRRQNLVFGVGNPNADLVIIGEAPGADEDLLGEPFVGESGKLLNNILTAIGFAREDIYICNILKCRPGNNRDPKAEEVRNCSPFLLQQLAHIQPKVILALGRIAGKTLLGQELSLARMRQQVHDFRGVPMVVTYHPAALLRNKHWKRPCWEDVKKAVALYRERGGAAGSLPTSS